MLHTSEQDHAALPRRPARVLHEAEDGTPRCSAMGDWSATYGVVTRYEIVFIALRTESVCVF